MIIKNFSINFKDNSILNNLNIEIKENKINVIVGKSGFGKTTLLNSIAGKYSNYTGEIIFEKEKHISYVFQEDILIPWKTVYQNLKIVAKNSYRDYDEKINKILQIVQLSNVKNSFPHTLSGGMKKRVNIARGMLFAKSYLLLDEPFEFLDINLQNILVDYIKNIQKELSLTIILVTHNLDIAFKIADNIIYLEKQEVFQNNQINQEKIKKLILENS